MKIILAPTDFSKNSLNAVNYAADMAVAVHAQLAVLHVIQIEEISGGPQMSVDPGWFAEDQYEFVKHKMQLLKSKLEKRTEKVITINTQIIEGSINSAIKEV